MKVYTKTGDKGTTSLYNGSRIGKYEIFFDVLGEIDELSSRIGMVCSLLNDTDITNKLREIQGKLQDINSIIATPNSTKKLPNILDIDISNIENFIDDLEKSNSKLVKFILPGVTQIDSHCHLCRTQTRKVERFLWKFHYDNSTLPTSGGNLIEIKDIHIDTNITGYINRLSDLFFVLARFLCKNEGFDDYFQ
tara:strand:+ start:2586 stop:3164 length:579 start_codon:yes stop_codon:yes gene_type:complete